MIFFGSFMYTYVIVITPLGRMWRVYRPDTRGRVAPEGGGPINRYIRPRGVIIVLLPVARWLISVVNHNDVRKAVTAQLDLKLLAFSSS